MRGLRAHRLTPLLLALAGAGFVPAAVGAQGGGSQTQGSGSQAQYEDLYEQEDEYEGDRTAFALGAGIVLPQENGREDGEVYFAASLRWRLGGRRQDGGGAPADYNERHNQRHVRGRYPGASGDGGIRGHLEPEVGYWRRSETDREAEDLMLGLNLVGVVPTRSADFYLGVGFGIHQIDGELLTRDTAGQVVDRLDLNDTRLGANVHVGVELHLGRRAGIFGSGRLDILEDEPFDRQTKIWGGVRFHFWRRRRTSPRRPPRPQAPPARLRGGYGDSTGKVTVTGGRQRASSQAW
jgi:hypothetical protein